MPRSRSHREELRRIKLVNRVAIASLVFCENPWRRLNIRQIEFGARYFWLHPDGTYGGIIGDCHRDEVVPIGIELMNMIRELREQEPGRRAA